MNLSFGLPMAVMLVGGLLYLFASPPKWQEYGRIMFAAGLLVTLLKFSGQASLHVG